MPPMNGATHTARAGFKRRSTLIRDHAVSRQHRPEPRIQQHPTSREMRPQKLSARSEPAQPATNSVGRHPEPLSDPAIPLTSDMSFERRADHRNPVTTPQKTDIGQQHVRAQTRPAPRPARHQPTIPGQAPQHPVTTMPPRPQHPATQRARQPARQQLSLHHSRLRTYDQHRVPPPASREPSRPRQADGRALARSGTRKACHQQQPITTINSANVPARNQTRRRSTARTPAASQTARAVREPTSLKHVPRTDSRCTRTRRRRRAGGAGAKRAA